jgi:hypothetical protein
MASIAVEAAEPIRKLASQCRASKFLPARARRRHEWWFGRYEFMSSTCRGFAGAGRKKRATGEAGRRDEKSASPVLRHSASAGLEQMPTDFVMDQLTGQTHTKVAWSRLGFVLSAPAGKEPAAHKNYSRNRGISCRQIVLSSK